MIEAVVGLLMFVSGDIKEARIQESMGASCLKPQASGGETIQCKNVRYQCWSR